MHTSNHLHIDRIIPTHQKRECLAVLYNTGSNGETPVLETWEVLSHPFIAITPEYWFQLLLQPSTGSNGETPVLETWEVLSHPFIAITPESDRF